MHTVCTFSFASAKTINECIMAYIAWGIFMGANIINPHRLPTQICAIQTVQLINLQKIVSKANHIFWRPHWFLCQAWILTSNMSKLESFMPCISNGPLQQVVPWAGITKVESVFIRFLGFIDLLKPNVADAIDRLSKLGIQVCYFQLWQ